MGITSCFERLDETKNKFLSEFLITVRKKKDNEEYEPNFLKAFLASFERHLKKKNRGLNLLKDVQFDQTRRESALVKAKGSKTVCFNF